MKHLFSLLKIVSIAVFFITTSGCNTIGKASNSLNNMVQKAAGGNQIEQDSAEASVDDSAPAEKAPSTTAAPVNEAVAPANVDKPKDLAGVKFSSSTPAKPGGLRGIKTLGAFDQRVLEHLSGEHLFSSVVRIPQKPFSTADGATAARNLSLDAVLLTQDLGGTGVSFTKVVLGKVQVEIIDQGGNILYSQIITYEKSSIKFGFTGTVGESAIVEVEKLVSGLSYDLKRYL